MVLMRVVSCGTLDMILRRIVIDGCNNSIIPKSKNEKRKVPNVSGGDTMCGINDNLRHIGKKGMSNCK